MRRVRRRLARQGHGAELEPGHALDGEVGIRLGVHALPVDAAIVAENMEHRVAGGEVLAHAIGRVHAQRLSLAQHEQARRVVDLAVDQDDAHDRGIAQRARRLQGRETAQLHQDVGRSVEQDPVAAVAAQRKRGLRARASGDPPVAKAVTVAAVAVPLREPAARGRTENVDDHGRVIRAVPRPARERAFSSLQARQRNATASVASCGRKVSALRRTS